MNACVQFEVVLCLEGLLADLTLEPPSDAVSGEVPSEVPFTRENLMARKRTDQTLQRGRRKPYISQT